MEFIIVEATSLIDGKVRFRMMRKSEYESMPEGWGMWCNLYGTHQHWDKEQARMEIDNLRLERQMERQLGG